MRECSTLFIVVSVLFIFDTLAVATTGSSTPMLRNNFIQSTRNHGTRNLNEDNEVDNSSEERAFDAKKLEELVNPTKINSALADATKMDKLFTSWGKYPALSTNVLKALSKNADNAEVIRAFKAHSVRDNALARAETTRGNIEWTMRDTRRQAEVFKSWSENEAVSNAIVSRLSKSFAANKEVLLAYNQYRTNLRYGKTFGGWLRMRDLEMIERDVKNKDLAKVEKPFTEWYTMGRTAGDIDRALTSGFRRKFKLVVDSYQDFTKYRAKYDLRQDRLAVLAKRVADEVR